MTFARGLRAILRQDPDVVMVGEIRDLETAEIAVQASLTGHLVMSTLHTNTAVGAVTRLIDMGVEPFLLSSSLVGMLAQRLVRVLCPDCKTSRPANAFRSCLPQSDRGNRLRAERAAKPARARVTGAARASTSWWWWTTRCASSSTTGPPSRSSPAYARRKAPSIRDDAVAKILKGVTTVQEVLKVTLEEYPPELPLNKPVKP